MFLSAFTLTAKADEILLKNGDKITGTIINKTGNTLEIKTEYSDKISINWSAVESFSTTQPVLLTFKNKEEMTGMTETSPNNTLKIRKKGVYQSEPIALSEITEINKKFFSGQVNAGGAIFSGNTQRQSYNLNTDLIVRGRDDRVSFGGQFNYADSKSRDSNGQKETVLNARNFQLYGDYAHFLYRYLVWICTRSVYQRPPAGYQAAICIRYWCWLSDFCNRRSQFIRRGRPGLCKC